MIRINLSAISGPHMLASAIESEDRDPVELTLDGQSCVVRSGSDYTEMRFGHGASVTIKRVDTAFSSMEPARVSWSSSSSNPQPEDAAVTAKLLGIAVATVKLLNEWAEEGFLARVNEARDENGTVA